MDSFRVECFVCKRVCRGSLIFGGGIPNIFMVRKVVYDLAVLATAPNSGSLSPAWRGARGNMLVLAAALCGKRASLSGGASGTLRHGFEG